MKRSSISAEKFVFKLGARQFQISGDLRENTGQRTKFKLFVCGNCDVMLSPPEHGREANMATRLPTDLVSVAAKELRKFGAAEISRQLQALMTSS